jgi:hypothetical protein
MDEKRTAMAISLIDVSTYLPGEPISADYYAQFADSDDLRDNLMFRAPKFRHHVAEDETAIDMVERAAAGLVERHGHDAIANVDVLITHTQMPDMPFYGGGGGMAHRLGMKPNWVIDLHNGGCAAFVLGLKLARNLLESGEGRTALIAVAQNAAGQAFDQPAVRRKAQASVPGDGAAVGLVTLSDESPILDVECRTYGEFAGDMIIVTDPPRRGLYQLHREQDHQGARPGQPAGARGGVRGVRPNRPQAQGSRPAGDQPAQPRLPAQLARGAGVTRGATRRHLRRLRQPVRRGHPREPGPRHHRRPAEEGGRRDDGGVRARR